jgi:hypothetical protein
LHPQDQCHAWHTTSQGAAVTQRLVRIVGDALPPGLAHLANGAFGAALAKAVDYVQHVISPITKIYANDWVAFRLVHRQWRAGTGRHPRPQRLVLILAAIAHHHRRVGLA